MEDHNERERERETSLLRLELPMLLFTKTEVGSQGCHLKEYKKVRTCGRRKEEGERGGW